MKELDFAISTVMIHDVPRGDSDATEMTLTDAPIQLDDQLREYFRSKIATSLQRGVDVIIDPTQDSTVCDAIVGIIREPASLPDQSRVIAARLHKVQTGVNPAGLVTVIYGTSDGHPAVSILKLEREEGIRFQVQNVQGRLTVDLQFLRDLTLTNKTKVFKTSLFFLEDPSRPESIIGKVADDQRGQVQGRGVADFFLSTFLGTQLRISPARATLEFVQAAEEFFNDSVRNPEKRGQYQVALLAVMQDQQLDVTPEQFAANHLDTADRPGFLDRVGQHGLPSGTTFEKDISLVKVKGFRMIFENGMVLVGGPDDLRERVRIRSEDAKQPGVDIDDAIKVIRGR